LGFLVQSDNFGVMVRSSNPKAFGGRPRRINTLSTHLIAAHPEYAGVSEMFDEAAAGDQLYMKPGEFVRGLYIPPPTQEEAFNSIKDGMPTRRERLWVGELSEQ
jgi:hypothetical protein